MFFKASLLQLKSGKLEGILTKRSYLKASNRTFAWFQDFKRPDLKYCFLQVTHWKSHVKQQRAGGPPSGPPGRGRGRGRPPGIKQERPEPGRGRGRGRGRGMIFGSFLVKLQKLVSTNYDLTKE